MINNLKQYKENTLTRVDGNLGPNNLKQYKENTLTRLDGNLGPNNLKQYKENTLTRVDGNLGPNLGQVQTCSGVKFVIGIPNTPLLITLTNYMVKMF